MGMKKKMLSATVCAVMVGSLAAPAFTVQAADDTLVYWSMWEATEPQGQVIQEAVDAYTEQTGVKVDLQFKGRTGNREALQPALDGGTQIDIFDEDIDRVNGMYGKYLLDLEDLAKENDYEATANAGLMAACRDAGGGTLKTIPYQPNVFAFFYNKDLFEQAGIEEFPQTWEEFWDCCEKLQARAITPLGLHTEGTGWSAMLLATAEMADSEEGAAFMNELYPVSYQKDCIYHMADTLQKLYKYTTKDAMNADFDVAYNNFIAGKSAMLANGYWMIDQLPEEFREKVRFSPFPGNKLISSPETFGWAVVDSYSDEVKQGAVEFLKFRTKKNKKLKEDLFSQDQNTSRLLQDYIRAYRGQPQIVPNYQVKWNSVLQESTLSEALPALAQKKITQADFVRMLTESITESKKEE